MYKRYLMDNCCSLEFLKGNQVVEKPLGSSWHVDQGSMPMCTGQSKIGYNLLSQKYDGYFIA